MRFLSPLLAVCALQAVSTAQISFPGGATYGYTIATEVSTSVSPSGIDTAGFSLPVPANSSQLDPAGSLNASTSGSQSFQSIEPPCEDGVSASITDLGPGVPGIFEFTMRGKPQEITFLSDGEDVHQHAYLSECGEPLSLESAETGVAGTAYMPFRVDFPITMTVEALDATGMYTPTKSGDDVLIEGRRESWAVVELWREDPVTGWQLVGLIGSSDFVGPLLVGLNPGDFAVVVKFEHQERFNSEYIGSGGSAWARGEFTDKIEMKLRFDFVM